MIDDAVYYSVGPLLYCPANRNGIAEAVTAEKFGDRYSLAFCLEDTVADTHVREAERKLKDSLTRIWEAGQKERFYVPKIFIRVRERAQIGRLMGELGGVSELVSGFIIPKFSLESADGYIEEMQAAGRRAGQRIYMMPIYESPSMIDLRHRYDILYGLKEKLDAVSPMVLNIRVGGNDLCHRFGFRRHSDESIHGIAPVEHIFSDILTVYGMDYVVSGPVWEYYDGPGWDTGLERELREDRLMGFVGKTVIHPKQIPLVNEAYRVPQKDLADARAILGWDDKNGSLVRGSMAGERMNEYKTHANWARRILRLAEAYGVKKS